MSSRISCVLSACCVRSIRRFFAFAMSDAFPANSLTSMRCVLPTASGRVCSYASGKRAMALACRPPLCANAEAPV